MAEFYCCNIRMYPFQVWVFPKIAQIAEAKLQKRQKRHPQMLCTRREIF